VNDSDYKRYVEDVLVAVADRQTGPNLTPINLDDLHHELFSDRPPTWLQTIIGELVRNDYGKDWQTMNARAFMVNGAGLARAQEIREERRPKTPVDYIKGFSRSDWIAFGALLISAIALLK
jgi:hypothetical protein